MMAVSPASTNNSIRGRAKIHTSADTARRRSRTSNRPRRPCGSAPFPGAVVLGDEGGEGVSKILHRHVGEGVDLDRGREGRHNPGPKLLTLPCTRRIPRFTTDCLQTGQKGEPGDLLQREHPQRAILSPREQIRLLPEGVGRCPDSRDILRDDCCLGGAGHPGPVPPQTTDPTRYSTQRKPPERPEAPQNFPQPAKREAKIVCRERWQNSRREYHNQVFRMSPVTPSGTQ